MFKKSIVLEKLRKTLTKRWRMIILIPLIFTLTTAIFNIFIIKPKYETSVKLFIGKESEDRQYDDSDVVMYQKLIKTYIEIIKTKMLVSEALEGYAVTLNLDNVLNNLTIVPLGDTQILQLKYKSEDPKVTMDVCRRIAKKLIEKSSQFIKNANVQVIESVQYPVNPVSPKVTLNISLSLLVGLILAIALAFAIEQLDNTFRTVEDVEEIFHIPVIGMIPEE